MGAEKIGMVKRGIEPFAMEPAALVAYLYSLNDLPLYDLAHEMFETSLYVEDNAELFTSHELKSFRRFNDLVNVLPPEEDDFWCCDSIHNDAWDRLRQSARAALKAFST